MGTKKSRTIVKKTISAKPNIPGISLDDLTIAIAGAFKAAMVEYKPAPSVAPDSLKTASNEISQIDAESTPQKSEHEFWYFVLQLETDSPTIKVVCLTERQVEPVTNGIYIGPYETYTKAQVASINCLKDVLKQARDYRKDRAIIKK